jgi:hypothetical protein
MPKDNFSVRKELMTDWPNHTRLLVEDMEMVKIHERKEMSTALRPGFRCSYPASTIKIPEMPIIDNLKACICPFGRVSMLCVEMECGAGLGMEVAEHR